MSDMAYHEHSDYPNDDRIRALFNLKWIGYTRAIQIKQQLDSLMNHPQMHRMPNLSIIGDSNNGKSTLLNHFLNLNMPSSDPNSEKASVPAVLIQTPPEPNESRLYRSILGGLGAEGPAKELPDSMLRRIRILFRALETRMLLLDDFHNILGGTLTKQQRVLNAIRYLGNELRIPIVVAGTIEAQRALSSDPQLANRFEPAYLHRWEMSLEFLRLLKTFEPLLGLKHPSNLSEGDIPDRLLIAGEGLIGDMLTLLRRLAERAIRTGTEQIHAEWLTKRELDAFGWVAPSERRRRAG